MVHPSLRRNGRHGSPRQILGLRLLSDPRLLRETVPTNKRANARGEEKRRKSPFSRINTAPVREHRDGKSVFPRRNHQRRRSWCDAFPSGQNREICTSREFIFRGGLERSLLRWESKYTNNKSHFTNFDFLQLTVFGKTSNSTVVYPLREHTHAATRRRIAK